MFKNIKYKFAALLALFTVGLMPIALTSVASANTVIDCAATGGNVDNTTPIDTVATDGSGCVAPSSTSTGTTLSSLVKTVINVFSLVVGLVSVVMIIVGGLRYITSGGDSGKVGTAKNTIIYAIIGLVIVALAQFIVQFVLGRANALG